MIICLLLPSCQLKKPEFSPETTIEAMATTAASETTDISETTDLLSQSTTLTTTRIYGTLATVPENKRTTSSVHTTLRQMITSAKTTTTKKHTTTTTTTKTATATATTTKAQAVESELRGIWISCYDHISAASKTRAQYKAETDTMFKNIKNLGLNTAFVHLRAFSDAFYESEIYPYSAFISGKEGASLSFDPFEVMLESAKAYGISVHGWINPFRVSTKKDSSLLSAKNPAKAIIDSGNANGEICVLENGIYYNPSCTENHKRIIDGVREIITKYDIDGIHIDDYFYPSTEKKVDNAQYSQYKADGGTLSLAQWRTANVNAFVSALYSAVKTHDSSLVVSISPSAKLSENKEKLYADCELWLSTKGYADLIIPQIYFGFEHETLGFNTLLNQWGKLKRNPSIKLACGIASYKCGTADNYAGSGKNEWLNNSDILARQTAHIRKNPNYSGFVLFSYQDLTRTGCKAEIQNLKETINTGTD